MSGLQCTLSLKHIPVRVKWLSLWDLWVERLTTLEYLVRAQFKSTLREKLSTRHNIKSLKERYP